MKNLSRISRTGIFYLLLILTVSCREREISPETAEANPETETSYTSVNQWIYEVMDDAYYWYQHMPALSSLNKETSPPEDFFEQLIYQRSSTDRFSMITGDIEALEAEFNGVTTIFGINYSLAYLDNTRQAIGLFISYVVKNSPADLAGIMRGDIITRVNNTPLTAANYYDLLSGNRTLTFTKGVVSGGNIIDSGTSVTITKAVVTENPVAFYSIIDKPESGKKIGYLVYTLFVPGTESDENEFDDQLRSIFGEFRQNGINELVLDHRFNPGGYISSAETLASLTGKNTGSSMIFYKEEWNSKYQAYLKRTYGEDAMNYPFSDEPNNVGSRISRVFILTSNGTASASEMVINGLTPYMEVVTIGENTYGKNLFGSLVEDEQKRWSWGMYVMLGRISNANGESDYGTVSGITPTYYIEDSQIPYAPFGSENETLLKKALEVMGVPAGVSARVAPFQNIERIRKEYYRDAVESRKKELIRNKTKPFSPGTE